MFRHWESNVGLPHPMAIRYQYGRWFILHHIRPSSLPTKRGRKCVLYHVRACEDGRHPHVLEAGSQHRAACNSYRRARHCRILDNSNGTYGVGSGRTKLDTGLDARSRRAKTRVSEQCQTGFALARYQVGLGKFLRVASQSKWGRIKRIQQHNSGQTPGCLFNSWFWVKINPSRSKWKVRRYHPKRCANSRRTHAAEEEEENEPRNTESRNKKQHERVPLEPNLHEISTPARHTKTTSCQGVKLHPRSCIVARTIVPPHKSPHE
ncbi:hypothetical protein B0H13DRAFT_1876373 [Mycena leptocephala]|nr:hypothetical protein B0H13DRAFT_1876373 [Mycena leptocephala]